MLPSQIGRVAEAAIKSVQKSGPDPVIFIILSLVFCIIAPFIEPKWLIAVIFFGLLAAYCWRMSQAERHDIALADKRLNLELAKLQNKKQTYQTGIRPIQPSLPLNSTHPNENQL